MWNVEESIALEVCVRFSSMSLAKISRRSMANGKEEYHLLIHDLYLDFVQRQAGETSSAWHRRLLDGHILPEALFAKDNDSNQVLEMLEYTPRAWWMDDIINKEYIRRNVCRHLLDGELGLELGAVVLDLRWMNAQAHTGGILGLKNDFNLLMYLFTKDDSPDRNYLSFFETVVHVLAAASLNLTEGPRVLSYILLSGLHALSETNEELARFVYNVKKATPKPYLTPLDSSYRPHRQGLQATINVKQSYQDTRGVKAVGFSKCGRYLVAGLGLDVVEMSIEQRKKMGCFKGHGEVVTVVTFNSDTSKIISGSEDGNVIVWDWLIKETPSLIFRGHSERVLGLALNGDESVLCSASLDGTLKIWGMKTWMLWATFTHEHTAKIVSVNSEKDMVATSHFDGTVRVINWVTEEIVLECRMQSDGIDLPLAVQFSSDGFNLTVLYQTGALRRWSTRLCPFLFDLCRPI